MSEQITQWALALFGGSSLIAAVFIGNKLTRVLMREKEEINKVNGIREKIEDRMRNLETNKVNIGDWHDSTKRIHVRLDQMLEDQIKTHSALCWLVGKQGGSPDEAGLT